MLLICVAQAAALHAPALGSVRRVPALRANKLSMDVTITPPTTTLLPASICTHGSPLSSRLAAVQPVLESRHEAWCPAAEYWSEKSLTDE